MRIRGYADSISAGAATVAEALARQTTMPVLKNIALRADDERSELWLQATDLKVGIVTKVPVTVDQAGEVTVSGQLFAQIMASFEDDAEIALALDEDWLRYECEDSSGEFTTIKYDDFPVLPEPADYGEQVARVGAMEFVQAIKAVIRAVSTDQAQPTLTGGLIEIFPEGIVRLSAVDGYQAAQISVMAKVRADVAAGKDGVPALREIVPRHTLQLLARLTEPIGMVDIFAGEQPRDLIFQAPNYRMITQLIDGTYPTISAVLEKGRDQIRTTIETYIEAFEVPFRRVRMFAKKGGGNDTVVFTAQPPDEYSPRTHPDENPTGVLLIDGDAAEIGGGHERLGCAIAGDAVRISFSSDYIQRAIAACPDAGARIRFQLNGPNQMALLSIATDESDWLCGIMPRSIGEE